MISKVKASHEANWLAALSSVIRILAWHQETDIALQSVLKYVTDDIRAADVAIIWRYSNSTGQFSIESASGLGLQSSKYYQIEIDAGMVESVFHTSKYETYISVGNVLGTDVRNKRMTDSDAPTKKTAFAIACFPLGNEKHKYGVLSFMNVKRKMKFSPDDLKFLQIITDMLNLVIRDYCSGHEEEAGGELYGHDNYIATLIPTVAHEMRTPLTSIKGFATALLMDEIRFNSQTQREFLEIIDRECDILVDLIENLLESSTIEAGNMKINLQPVRLRYLAEKAIEDVGRRFPQHSVLVDCIEDFPIIDADPERVLQILRQLLDNAAKYSPKGGLIVLQVKIDGDMAVISVADEGVGIAPEDLNHLFDRFFRAKSNSGTQIIGTGLGLPICRAIVEAHGGRIWAESQPGQGSKFFFSLPLKSMLKEQMGKGVCH